MSRESNLIRYHGSMENVPSPARIAEMYGPRGPYLSARTIAIALRLTPDYVRKRLREMGISRSRGEQQRLDCRLGRKDNGKNNPEGRGPFRDPEWQAAKNPGWAMKGKRQSRLLVEKRTAPMRQRITVFCAWCGERLEVWPCRLKWATHLHCNRLCSAKGTNFRRFQPGAPRPLITARLKALCRDRALTYDNVAKQAQKIGAAEPEIFAVLGMTA